MMISALFLSLQKYYTSKVWSTGMPAVKTAKMLNFDRFFLEIELLEEGEFIELGVMG